MINLLNKPVDDRTEMREWAKQFTWKKIAKKWDQWMNIQLHKQPSSKSE